MSIASELNALNGYILGAYDEINTKGGTVPTNKNMANLASAIGSISTGSSTTITPLNVTENGTYTAPTGTAYSPVTVNVSGGGGEQTIQGYNVISGTITPDVTDSSLILMSYADFMSAVGGVMPSFSMLGMFNKSSNTPGFSHKFGYYQVNTSPHYVNDGRTMTRGSMGWAFAVWNPNTPGSSFDGVRVTTYNGTNSGKFQAGTEYVWFILWK